MHRQRVGEEVLKLHFADHFHNFRENWQVGNESIVQIDCQVIRKVIRTGNDCSCFKLSRNSARCEGGSCTASCDRSPVSSGSLKEPRGPRVQTIG